jgi:lipopolysaccharide/colanic/teichoic acid biosynthesis glycosyltransferase
VKRCFDFLAAFMGLTILAPLLAFIALAIWIEDRGSPFFLGTRVARGGGDFVMVKFRSMIPDAWKNGVNSTAGGDRRITRVGAYLRQAKLDELPQLWHVLKGDMSLVGPRPQVRADAELYTAQERAMLSIRPGITDLASIVFSDEGEILAGSADPDLVYNQIIRPWKSRLALLYVDQQTLRGDLMIICLTLVGAFSRARALAGVEAMLQAWQADPVLRRVAARREPLSAWPPPGAQEIVRHYPGQTAGA